ncbi:MAG: sodium:calcium antiporter, partial [Pontimonas sp.]
MLLLDLGLVVAGLALLIGGGEALVRGASTLAVRAGLSPLVIGLVVVSAA